MSGNFMALDAFTDYCTDLKKILSGLLFLFLKLSAQYPKHAQLERLRYSIH